MPTAKGATLTLEDLRVRALDGERGALSELCRRLETPVFRLCVRMLGDVHDAEDATQDVMVKVITHLSQFEGRSALSTWAHQIAVRHVLALRRGRAEARALDEPSFARLLEQGLAFGATLPPPTPEQRALTSEVRLACTQAMLLMLTREERLALVLVELLGFDGAEASAITESSHDAFRQRLARARTRLGTFLALKCGEASPTAACTCEGQLPAKTALGLCAGLTVLAEGDATPAPDAGLATQELAAVRAIASAFHREGAWRAPTSLRARIEAALPSILL